jgi:hypothetical protein
VDSLQGNIRELRSDIQYHQSTQDYSGTSTALIKKTKKDIDEAIDESKTYVIFLEKESVKIQDEVYQNLAEYKRLRKDKIEEVISVTKSTVGKLEALNLQLTSVGTQNTDSLSMAVSLEATPLILESMLEKARMNSFELKSHLVGKSVETDKSEEHYIKLIRHISEIEKQLAGLNTNMPLELLDKELGSIETETVLLTQQSPYTLFMMRAVEIGLPLLLSIFSVFFILRYSLTETRSHEIKELLKQRNLEQLEE